MKAINEWHHYQEAMLQWEKDIENSHPVISYFPIERWPGIARFNGWLPLPPVKPSESN